MFITKNETQALPPSTDTQLIMGPLTLASNEKKKLQLDHEHRKFPFWSFHSPFPTEPECKTQHRKSSFSALFVNVEKKKKKLIFQVQC